MPTAQQAPAAAEYPSAQARALLISMPFYSVRTPSPQLGLLSAIGRSHGFRVDTLHLNLEFAARVGRNFYEELCAHRGPEVGNWLFALAAFGDEAPDRDGLFLQNFPGAVGFAANFD